MTYDEEWRAGYDYWKSTEPDPYAGDVFGQCDCCAKERPLSQCWPSGMETWACDECRGIEDEGTNQ